ncbi:hypothetical protein PZA11_006467 [Diplocarpon coronariae]|uniref:SUR7 protein n=1 Tax=Diplocarpon coronariae TaxID=2795749 RepID=A0A218ZD80_9HELO|nr:hypothetical protein JHW43_005207 [Diplocarpon mali]OWP05245.1 hypothetical protein B2J93_7987 [Marssonina coronariae]
MGAGRFVCVAVPFGLTLASLVCLLIVMLAGITNKSLDMFEIKTQNLSISSSSLLNLADLTKRDDSLSALTIAGLSPNEDTNSNITASELGLADKYRVSMWNYCAKTGSDTNCTKAKYNWAASKLNTTHLEEKASNLTNGAVSLPSELKTALKTYKNVSRWTQIVYIMAFINCVSVLALGLFGFCSRVGSCLTFVVSSIAAFSVVVASVMATVTSSLVIAAVKSTTKAYGVKGSINRSFLVTTWFAAAFSIGAAMFWMLTICCCASSHHSGSARSSRGLNDQEKLVPTAAYQRVDDSTHFNNGFAGQQNGVLNGQQNTEYGVPLANVKPVARGGNGAYEPYSHTAI